MIDLSELKPGQKVRAIITYEGTVGPHTDGLYLHVSQPGGWVVLSKNYDRLVVELIEPDYILGEMYQDDKGDYWCYDELHDSAEWQRVWYSPGDRTTYGFDCPERPLRRMVPQEA